VLGDELVHPLANDGSSGPSKNVTDKKKAQPRGS